MRRQHVGCLPVDVAFVDVSLLDITWAKRLTVRTTTFFSKSASSSKKSQKSWFKLIFGASARFSISNRSAQKLKTHHISGGTKQDNWWKSCTPTCKREFYIYVSAVTHWRAKKSSRRVVSAWWPFQNKNKSDQELKSPLGLHRFSIQQTANRGGCLATRAFSLCFQSAKRWHQIVIDQPWSFFGFFINILVSHFHFKPCYMLPSHQIAQIGIDWRNFFQTIRIRLVFLIFLLNY